MGKNSGKPHSTRSTKPEKGMETQVVVAIIAAISTIILALFTFPPFVKLFEKDPTPTAIFTATNTSIPEATVEPTQPNIATASNTPIPTTIEMVAPTITQAPTSTATSTPTSGLPVGMDVQLYADRTDGHSPLAVSFDARDSFLRDANGDIFNCGVCNYTWYVYKNSTPINNPDRSNNGTFTYRFGNDGEYRVVVKVCRGQGESDCGYDAEIITVR